MRSSPESCSPATAAPTGGARRNFVAHLRALAAHRPDDVALIVAGEHDGQAVDRPLSYAQLDARVRSLAARLQALFAPGERALLLLDNDDHYAVAFLACAYAGLVAVPAFPPESLRPQHLARLSGMAADAGARCVLTTAAIHAQTGALFDSLAPQGVVAVDLVGPDAAPAWRPCEPADSDIAFLQYTSGSTAAPKGVMVSHANLMANERVMEQTLGLRADDVFVSWLPLYHDMGLIGGLLQPLHRGAPVVLMTPRFFLERPLRWLEAMSRHRATVSGGPDFAFRLCLERIKEAQLADLDLSAWRIAYTGAEPVRHDTLQAFGERFMPARFHAAAFQPCYGLAEATLFITGGRPGQDVATREFCPDALARGQVREAVDGTPLVGCGRTAEGHALRISDPATGHALGGGEVGEIWASGPSVAGGYWGNPAASAQALVERDGQRWLRTGDLGFELDGQLFVTGRIKDLIIVRGHNLYPQDIERAVEREVEAVRPGRVAAFATTGAGGEGIGVAAEVSRGMRKLVTPEVLVQALSMAVGELCGEPVSVVALLEPGSLPKTSSGKLQRQACRRGVAERTLDAYAIWEYDHFVVPASGQPAVAEEAGAPQAQPGDEIEQALAGLWREALALEQDAPLAQDAHFFGLGGNSLAATRLAARTAAHWGIDYGLRALFEQPTLGAAAQAVREALRAQRPHEAAAAQAVTAIDPSLRGSALALSAAQQRQWFLWCLDPQGTAYHVSGALRLTGTLDERALAQALQGLFDRHECLRTVFEPGEDNQGRQRILPHVEAVLQVIDPGMARADDPAAPVDAPLRALQDRPFDLGAAPLLRAALIRHGDGVHTLALVMHHIISDAASMQLLVDELGLRYQALRRAEPVPLASLAPLALQYADYAAWQRGWLAAGAHEAGERQRQLAYWLGELAGEADPLVLPCDHPRPEAASHLAGHWRLPLPADLDTALRAAALRHGVTPFMLLLTGLQVLLHRYGGREDIRVGVPIANRHRAGTEAIVGFFVNTLVLRNRLAGRLPLAQALAQTRRAALDAQTHQDLPFEQLVDLLRPERVVGSSPLFQVLFNHLREDYRALEAATECAVRSLPVDAALAQFDLSVEIREAVGGDTWLHLAYARELFEEQTIQGLGERYLRVLRALVDTPDLAIGDVVLDEPVRPARRPAPVRTEPAAQTLHGRFEQWAAQQPDAVAVVYGDIALSYAELDRRANRLAQRLVARGLAPEARVGVALERSEHLPVALLAVLKAGAAYVPLDPSYPAERLAYIAADAGVGLLLTESALADRASSLTGLGAEAIVLVDGAEAQQGPQQAPPLRVHPDQLAYVIHTSGSTGAPKGAQLTHRNVGRLLDAAAPWLRCGPQDTWTLFHSYAFDFSVWELFGALCTGGRLVVVPFLTTRSPDAFLALLRAQRVTVLNQTPSAFRQLVDAVQRGGGQALALREVIFGGEALEPESLRPWFESMGDGAPRLVNMFGITETTVHVTWRPLGMADLGRRQCSPIGVPLDDLVVRVLDAELNPLPPGMPGELHVSGPGLARGYLGRAGLTATRFVADPFDTGGARMYRTGDLARQRADGQIEYLGRIDQQVKIRGFRIELGEIDAQLLELPQVRHAATVAVEAADGAQLAAYVVLNAPVDPAPQAGAESCAAALRSALSQRLPDYMVPATVTVLEALPLTANGKLDRRALPAPAKARAASTEPPQGRIAETLAEIWCEVLGIERVGAHDNFFDLGGHSLQVLRVHRLIGERIGGVVTVVELFKHPTLAGLAERIGQGADRPDPAAPQQEARLQRQLAAMQRRRQAGGSSHERVL